MCGIGRSRRSRRSIHARHRHAGSVDDRLIQQRVEGGTIGRACASGLRGAAYATSDVVVGPGRIASWDRGFDAAGIQVWGAENGAYVFLRGGDAPDTAESP